MSTTKCQKRLPILSKTFYCLAVISQTRTAVIHVELHLRLSPSQASAKSTVYH